MEKKQNSASSYWGSMDTPFSNDHNLLVSERGFTIHYTTAVGGQIKSAERQSKLRKFKWRANENMQGKDGQAASARKVFTGIWLLLLRISFSADHSVDIKKNTF